MRLYPSYIDCQNSADNNCMEILLSKIMHERNLTVRQVEQMTKVPKSTINDIMNGSIINRTNVCETLENICFKM